MQNLKPLTFSVLFFTLPCERIFIETGGGGGVYVNNQLLGKASNNTHMRTNSPERERERDRQTDRQTDRQRQTETDRDRDRQTDRDRDRDRQKQRQTDRGNIDF